MPEGTGHYAKGVPNMLVGENTGFTCDCSGNRRKFGGHRCPLVITDGVQYWPLAKAMVNIGQIRTASCPRK